MICLYIIINLLKFFFFADDTSILVTGKNDAELKHKVMDILSLIVNWFAAHKLALNLKKTTTITFAPKHSFNSLAVPSGNLFMNEVPVIKFLSLQIDKNLEWKSHVEYILPELSSAIFLIRSISYFMGKIFL
jgi:hypothetical protein